MNFIEPDVQQTVYVSDVFKKINISSENKEWLLSLFLKKEIPCEIQSDLEDILGEIIKKSNEVGLNSFKVLILFNYYGILSLLPDCFDNDKLSCERKKILPELFTQKQNDKPEIFQAYVVNILYGIRDYAEKDKNFSDAYQKKLQEIRTSSSFEERAVYYVKLVFHNLHKRTYKEGEKPPTQEEIDSFLHFWEKDLLNMPYSLKLIAELEEMPENELYIEYIYPLKYDISAFPFIICGKELYSCIYRTMKLLNHKTLGREISTNDIIEIKIPHWNDNNYIHEFFFEEARLLKDKDKDISMLILDKVFEDVNPVVIPNVFFEYIETHTSSSCGRLLKGGYSDIIEPIRDKLEYLDWAVTSVINDPHKIYFDKSQLFLDYIKKLSDSAPEDKLELFKELCFKKSGKNHHFQAGKYWNHGERTIQDILVLISREISNGEWRIPEQKEEADKLYDEFVNAIAEGAAKYPVKSFLVEEFWNLSMQKQNDHGLNVFKRYCEKLELKTPEDAIFISEFWFKMFYLEQSFFTSVSHTSYRYSSELEEEGPFFYKNIFYKFIENEDFICHFLSSIPIDSSSALSLAVYCFACWVLYQKNKDENVSDIISVIKKASKLLYDDKITFPDKIAEFIRSYKIPDGQNEARLFLFSLSAALDGEQYQNILKNLSSNEELYPLFYIRYKYSHENFIPEEFLDFLFSLKDQSRRGNEYYNLELIQEACKEGVLKKQIVLEKVSDYIEKNRELLFKSLGIEKFINYFFIKTEEGESNDTQMSFFIRFCERAIQENEDSYKEIYLFLRIFNYFHIDTILEKYTEINDELVTKCCKMLNNLKKNVEQKEFPEGEFNFLNDYILPASDFILERTGSIWKALKPLILAFRASKDILLDESLDPIKAHSLLNKINSFFRIEDQEKLMELRYNMANDFADYLKPAKKERQAEKYTKKEQETEGFYLPYTEPSSYWRYAYVRALGDLGVKTDKRGHYFQKILENVSEKDPSEEVKKAAKKVMKELDSIRNGYSGNNHKKCLFEAFWWLKNAHMLSLDGEIDPKKALEQRIKEWR